MSNQDHAQKQFALDTGGVEFARGTEIGSLGGVLAYQTDAAVTAVIRRDNVENALRVAAALGRKFHTTDECPDGCCLKFRFEAIDD